MKKKLTAIMAAIVMLTMLGLPLTAMASPINVEVTFRIEATDDNPRTFNAYKVFDVTGSAAGGYSYSLANKFSGFTGYPTNTTESLHEYLMSFINFDTGLPRDAEETETALRALIDSLMDYIRTPGATVAPDGTSGAVVTGFKANIPDLAPGYYLITGQSGDSDGTDNGIVAVFSLMTFDSDNYEINIYEKADIGAVPVITKTANVTSGSSVTVGDPIAFTLATAVPDTTGFDNNTYEFVVTDTMSGLTLNSGLAVRVGAVGSDPIAATNYALTMDGDGFELKFLPAFFNNYAAGQDVTITYTAFINGDAVATDTSLDNPGAGNLVFLTYSNDPDSTATGSTSSDVEYELFDIDMFKYFGEDRPLANAVFELRQGYIDEDNEGTLVPMVMIVEGDGTAPNVYRKALTGETPVNVVSPASGLITLRGFATGEYQIIERSAPSGYSRLRIPVLVEIDVNGDVEWSVADREGAGIINIENRRSSPFPETGGVGRAAIYMAGFATISVAGTALIIRGKAKTAGKAQD